MATARRQQQTIADAGGGLLGVNDRRDHTSHLLGVAFRDELQRVAGHGRAEPLDQDVDHALAAEAVAARPIVVRGRIVANDHGRRRAGAKEAALEHVALEAAAADRAGHPLAFAGQHACARAAVGRTVDADDGGQDERVAVRAQ